MVLDDRLNPICDICDERQHRVIPSPWSSNRWNLIGISNMRAAQFRRYDLAKDLEWRRDFAIYERTDESAFAWLFVRFLCIGFQIAIIQRCTASDERYFVWWANKSHHILLARTTHTYNLNFLSDDASTFWHSNNDIGDVKMRSLDYIFTSIDETVRFLTVNVWQTFLSGFIWTIGWETLVDGPENVGQTWQCFYAMRISKLNPLHE